MYSLTVTVTQLFSAYLVQYRGIPLTPATGPSKPLLRCGARAAVSYGFATSRLPTHANRVTAS